MANDEHTRPNALGETRPGRVYDETRPMASADRNEGFGTGAEALQESANHVPWGLIAGILVLAIVILVVGGGSGYFAGVEARDALRATQQADFLQEQFDLGVVDIEAGRHLIARDRFEYILGVDPDFPGARDLLNLALEALNEPTGTPSPTATEITLTPTPTLSLSSLEGLLEAGRGAVASENWDAAIEALLALRSQDPDYRLEEANALMFTALRNRGMQKIIRKEIEQGVYDLKLAARVGVLDGVAQSWMRSGEFYAFANSFFGLDWVQAVANFAGLCGAGIWDSCYKYSVSAAEYGHLLMDDELYCEAAEQYDASLTTRDQEELHPTATFARESCLTATAGTPTPSQSGTPGTVTPTFTLSATLTQGGPIETDTPTPTATVTLSETPTTTPTSTPTATTETPNP